jgi:hypothetical protein
MPERGNAPKSPRAAWIRLELGLEICDVKDREIDGLLAALCTQEKGKSDPPMEESPNLLNALR